MKKIFNVLLVTLLGLYLISCSKEDDKIELKNISSAKITVDKNTVVLDEIKAGQNALAFNWENPTFNPSVGFTNALQFAIAGTGFSQNVLQDLPGDQKNFSLTHLQLNNILAQLNVGPDTAKPIEIRMRTALNSTTFFYSNIITVNMTGYMPNPDLIYPKINIPGSYAGAAGYADWAPGNSPNLFSPEKNEKYRGFIWINTVAGAEDGKYKFTINQDWPGNKGDDGTNSGKLKADGDNVKANAIGTYYIKVDWVANTYSSVLSNFGIIGDATPTGWGSDTKFVYNPATKSYVINSIALINSGVFKFRANDDWVMKFQPKKDDETLTSGKGIQTYFNAEDTVTGDPGYKVSESGNYKIELDLHNSAYYKLTITKL